MGSKLLKGVVLTIKPSAEQAAFLKIVLGAQRWIWNRFLENNRIMHRFTGHFVFYEEMCKFLPALKRQERWLADIPSQTLQQTLKRLGKAIRDCFRSGFGFPKFKEYWNDDSATFPQGFKIEGGSIFLPKVGWMRLRCRKPIDPSRIRNVTVSYDKVKKRWKASACVEIREEPLPRTGKAIGLDMGSVRLFTDSDGNFAEALRFLPGFREKAARIAKFQRQLSDIEGKIRKDRFRGTGSAGWLSHLREKKRRDLARAHRKLADFCRDILHKLSRRLVEGYDLIAVEDLKLKNMTRSAKGTIEDPGRNVAQKSGLNRNLLSNRISTFLAMLEHKCSRCGKILVRVDPRLTSRTCSACGCESKDNRPDQARFCCRKCGNGMNADHNAAINMLSRGMSVAAGSGAWIASL